MPQPLRLLVGFSAGSASNFVARIIAPALGEALDRTVVVERIEGENGALCAEFLMRAAPDGNTLAMAIQANTVGALLQPKKRYDPIEDFTPVAMIAKSPMVMAVSNALGVNSVAELVALARVKPGQLCYAASALGGAPHLGGVLFTAMAGIDMPLRLYAQTDALWQDMVQGRIDMAVHAIMAALPLARAGKVRLLAVTGPERSPQAPDLPTAADALPGYELVNYVGLVAPAGTPSGIVKTINAAVAKAVNNPAVRQELVQSGMEPVVASPDAFAQQIHAEVERWRRFIAEHPAAFSSGQSPQASVQPPQSGAQ